MPGNRSQDLFEEAQRFFPGGVNSPVRAFRAVGGTPPFIARAQGARLWDEDGREYLDYVLSWGPMILGHAHPDVVRAIQTAAERGTSYGAPTLLEVDLARRVQAAFPSMERLRMVSSGTEAVMSAVRVARGFTGRSKIIKCEGCYHGHADYLLVKAGSGAATLGVPDSAGVPEAFAGLTVTLPFNDLPALERTLSQERDQIACVILEPVPGNMGVVPPRPGYLEGVRRLTAAHGALLVFDEVITGFRLAYGGAQALYGVRPDLTCLGKILGGGLPVGAYGGRREIMEQVAPLGPVYQAGTLSGNPLAMAAGIATLDRLTQPGAYAVLEEKGARLEQGIREALQTSGKQARLQRVGSMFTIFFTSQAVTDYAGAQRAEKTAFARFFQGMLAEGVYLPPSQFEAGFLSLAHTAADLEQTIHACKKVLTML